MVANQVMKGFDFPLKLHKIEAGTCSNQWKVHVRKNLFYIKVNIFLNSWHVRIEENEHFLDVVTNFLI